VVQRGGSVGGDCARICCINTAGCTCTRTCNSRCTDTDNGYGGSIFFKYTVSPVENLGAGIDPAVLLFHSSPSRYV